MRKLFLALLWLALPFPGASRADVNVFACEPEWGALARELGGERVTVYEATGPLQDPHRIEPRPSLIARARGADLVVCTGAEMESAWLPVLLRESGNARIQQGRPGYFEAAQHVELLEKPARVDRSEGDVHAAGNPHIQGDPRNMAEVARALASRLAEIDAANAGHYRERHATFARRWADALEGWQAKGAPLRGVPVVLQHRNPYLLNWLGLREAGTLEPLPGIEPTPVQLSALIARLEKQPARMIIRPTYLPARSARWLGEKTGLPVVEIPFTVGGDPQVKDLFGLYDETLNRLLRVLK